MRFFCFQMFPKTHFEYFEYFLPYSITTFFAVFNYAVNKNAFFGNIFGNAKKCPKMNQI